METTFTQALSDALRTTRLDVTVRGAGDLALVHGVRPGLEKSLARFLETGIDCDSLADDGVHWLRLVPLERGTRLLCCGEVDAPFEDTFARLVDRHRPAFDRLWGHCEQYPATALEDATAFAAFLADGQALGGYRYDAYPQASVQQIRRALDWMRKTVSYQIELAKTPRS